MDGWNVEPDAASNVSTILVGPNDQDSAGKPVTSDKTITRVLTIDTTAGTNSAQ